jgi:hypothetical protein
MAYFVHVPGYGVEPCDSKAAADRMAQYFEEESIFPCRVYVTCEQPFGFTVEAAAVSTGLEME